MEHFKRFLLFFFVLCYTTAPLQSQHSYGLPGDPFNKWMWPKQMLEQSRFAGPETINFNDVEYRLDSVYYYFQDESTTDLQLQYKLIYAYNTAGIDTGSINLQWLGLWHPNTRYTKTSDVDGRTAEITIFPWNDALSAWIPTFRFAYAYSGQSTDVSESVTYQWDMTLQSWLPLAKVVLEYDTDSNPIDLLDYEWDSSLDTWVLAFRTSVTYDGYVAQTSFAYNPENGAWEPYLLSTKEYNADSSELIQTNYNFDTTASMWIEENRSRTTYEDISASIEITNQFQWSYAHSIWVPHFRTQTTQDVNANLFQELYFNWQNGAWNPFNRNDYYWSEHEITSGVLETASPDYLLYPNPVRNVLFVSGIQGKVSMDIFNENGRLMQSKEAIHPGEAIGVDYLPAGVYTIRLTSGNQVAIRQFVKPYWRI